MAKLIPTSKGKVAIVDDSDFQELSQYKWYCNNVGSRHYVRGRAGGRDLIYMHRLIMDASQDQEVDHINGNTLDNRRSNLRLCNRSQNNCNQGLRTDNTSGYIGVDFHKHKKKWRARVYDNGQTIFLGFFDTAKEAAVARNHAAEKHYGEFAEFNDIKNWKSIFIKKRPITWAKSGYRGVTKCNNRWRAHITVNKKRHHLGYFDTPELAAKAYDNAAKQKLDNKAKLNFPTNNYEKNKSV